MIKLVSLLAAGMFLTLLIGGEDKGQTRQGLIGVVNTPAVERPVVRAAVVAPAADVKLANFAPVTVTSRQLPPPPIETKRANSVIIGPFVIDGAPKVAQVAAPEAAAAVDAVPDFPIMYVSSNAVNVRQGPSTDYEVVGRLTRAEAVTVVSAEQDGWVKIIIEGDGLEGFIAARLLSDRDPASN